MKSRCDELTSITNQLDKMKDLEGLVNNVQEQYNSCAQEVIEIRETTEELSNKTENEYVTK